MWKSQTMSLAAPPRAIPSPEGSWPTLSMSRREGVQLCNVATGRILEAPEYFRHGWMRINNYVAEAPRNHIDTRINSSNDRPGNLTVEGEAFMRPIIELPGGIAFRMFRVRLFSISKASCRIPKVPERRYLALLLS